MTFSSSLWSLFKKISFVQISGCQISLCLNETDHHSALFIQNCFIDKSLADFVQMISQCIYFCKPIFCWIVISYGMFQNKHIIFFEFCILSFILPIIQVIQLFPVHIKILLVKNCCKVVFYEILESRESWVS